MTETTHTNKVQVGILIASLNDLPKVAKAWETLDELGVHSEIVIASIQQNPDKVMAYLDQAHTKGVQVLIDCAGIGNLLTDAIAGHTPLPEVGIPLANGSLAVCSGLQSIVQRAPDVPIATVAIDDADKAAIWAAHLLALKYPYIDLGLMEIADREKEYYEETAEVSLGTID